LLATSVVIDVASDILIDARIEVGDRNGMERGDYDADGNENDTRYTVRYSFANQRFRHTEIVLVITDLKTDLTIDSVAVVN
jgi:hypothetical protein